MGELPRCVRGNVCDYHTDGRYRSECNFPIGREFGLPLFVRQQFAQRRLVFLRLLFFFCSHELRRFGTSYTLTRHFADDLARQNVFFLGLRGMMALPASSHIPWHIPCAKVQ